MKREECTWWVNHLFNIAKVSEWNKGHVEDAKEIETAQQMAIDALSNANQHVQSVGYVDLISRQDAIEAFRKSVSKSETEDSLCYNLGLGVAEKVLESLPSADAVEVVRCKDCKFYTDARAMPNKSCCGFCSRLGAISYYGVDATDYCSFAERREP